MVDFIANVFSTTITTKSDAAAAELKNISLVTLRAVYLSLWLFFPFCFYIIWESYRHIDASIAFNMAVFFRWLRILYTCPWTIPGGLLSLSQFYHRCSSWRCCVVVFAYLCHLMAMIVRGILIIIELNPEWIRVVGCKVVCFFMSLLMCVCVCVFIYYLYLIYTFT